MPMTNKKDPAARCRKLADKDSVVLARLEQTRLVPYVPGCRRTIAHL